MKIAFSFSSYSRKLIQIGLVAVLAVGLSVPVFAQSGNKNTPVTYEVNFNLVMDKFNHIAGVNAKSVDLELKCYFFPAKKSFNPTSKKISYKLSSADFNTRKSVPMKVAITTRLERDRYECKLEGLSYQYQLFGKGLVTNYIPKNIPFSKVLETGSSTLIAKGKF